MCSPLLKILYSEVLVKSIFKTLLSDTSLIYKLDNMLSGLADILVLSYDNIWAGIFSIITNIEIYINSVNSTVKCDSAGTRGHFYESVSGRKSANSIQNKLDAHCYNIAGKKIMYSTMVHKSISLGPNDKHSSSPKITECSTGNPMSFDYILNNTTGQASSSSRIAGTASNSAGKASGVYGGSSGGSAKGSGGSGVTMVWSL